MTSINPERAASLSPTQQPQHAHTAQVEDDSAFESLVTSSKALLEALQTWVIANTRHVDNVNLLPLPATTTTTVTTSATARSTDTDEQPAPSPSIQDDDTAALHDFDAAWTSYYNFFEAWKDKDAQRLLKTLLDHAQQLESLWRTVQSDPTARSEWGPRIEEQRRDLRNKARQLVGPDGVARVDIVFADFVSATTPSPPSTAAVAAAHSPASTITATPPVTPVAVSAATPMETDTETAAPEPHAETVEPSSSSAPLEPTTPSTAAAVTATKKRQRVLSVSNTDSAMDVDEPSATLTGGRSTHVVISTTTGGITAAAAPSDDPTASTGEEPQPKKPTRARGPRQPMLPAGFEKQDNWSNLQLIHELALDPNFKIESQRVGGGGSTSLAPASDAAEGTSSSSSSGNSMESLESRIRAMATKAYFDKIREDAEQGQLGKWIAPLLTTIREQLLDMVPPESTVARQIRDGFDLDFVQQQVDEKVYNIKGALESVLALMAKLCAPVRDPAIRKIQQDLSIITGNPFQQGSQALPGDRPAASATPTTPKDLVSVLKDILELLEEMLMDLANYRLMVARPSLEKQAIPYEQHAFKTSLENGEVTLDATTAWLEESAANVLRASLVPTTTPGAGAGAGSREPSKTNRHYEVYVNAVLDLLYSKTPLDMASKEKFPETFVLDQARLTRYQNEIQALALISVMWNISLNVQPPLRDEGQEELKQTLFRLMESANTSKEVLAEAIIEAKEKELLLSSRSSSSPSSSSSSTLTPTRSTATATAPTTAASLLLSPEQKAYLHNTIERAISFDSTLYNVLSQRIRKVLESYLLSSPPGAKPGVMPDQAELNKSGLGTMAKEIGAFAAQVGFLIRYNAKVYQPWYDPLLTKILPGNARSPAKPRTATATTATAVTTTSAPIVPPAPDAAIASTASGEAAETTVSDNAAPPSTTTTAPKVEATEQVKDKDGDNSNNDKTPSTSLPV
ncbi:MAG: T-complex protein 11-domain-containing protein [Linnemannia gamsii]|nr:MAG: T-complex protein 11-domain-containing protein [Linnemannia gamsii]